MSDTQDSDRHEAGTYRCHSSKNQVSALLLTDPLYNDRLQSVMANV